MSNREEVIEQLRKIVEQRGGKKTGMKAKLDKLGEVDASYRNQYVNDGSLAYKKTRVGVIDKILDVVYNMPGLNGAELQKARGTVPESMIDDAMEELKKVRAKEIKLQRENDKIALQTLNEVEDTENLKVLQKNLAALDAYKPLKTNVLDKQLQLKNPEMYDLAAKLKVVPTAGPRSTVLEKADTDALAALDPYFGRSGRGLKKKRAPSEYNLFVKAYMKKHKNASLADAARAWKA